MAPAQPDNLDRASIAPRSRSLLSIDDSILIVIDIQEKLLPLILDADRIAFNTQRLIDGANELNVEIVASVQYPKALGNLIAPIQTQLAKPHEKRMFSCRECNDMLSPAKEFGKRQLVICGIESHICILQSCLDWISDGWEVYIVADAVGSRCRQDHDIALRRMELHGAVLATTESVLFEWCETSTHPSFKAISQIVRREIDSAS